MRTEAEWIIKKNKRENISDDILMKRFPSWSSEEKERFLYPSVKDVLPEIMKDTLKGIEIIKKHIKEQNLIILYSDYDSDGICSAVIGVDLLRKLGANVAYYTNNRFIHGYGINPKGVIDMLKKYPNAACIITTDNGISAHEGVAFAKEKGLDVVVTDHHEVSETLPPADAVINPKRKDDPYSFKGLAGAGVIFKFFMYFFYHEKRSMQEVMEVLDILAIATVGDLVPLINENRFFVKEGLRLINESPRKSITLLKEKLNLPKELNAHYHIGFKIAPTLNAIGRLEGDPYEAIAFLLEDMSEEEMNKTANRLVEINEERKKITEEQTKIATEALKNIEEMPPVIVIEGTYHEGIVGLIASRIKETYYRPVFVFSEQENGICKASARSIPSFHLKEELDKCKDLLLGYGGHKMAAGLSIKKENLEKFKERIIAQASVLTKDDLTPKIEIDHIVHHVGIDLVEELKKLEPFGVDFPFPTLMVSGYSIDKPFYMGTDKQHIKFSSNTHDFQCIGFYQAEEYDTKNKPKLIDVIGTPSINVWNGNVSYQFIIQKWREHQQK